MAKLKENIKLLWQRLRKKYPLFVRTERKFINLNDAKEIGLIYPWSIISEAAIRSYTEQLRAEGKNVLEVGFINLPKLPPSGLPEPSSFITIFCKKDLNILKHPHGNTMDKFLAKEFDLLINLDVDFLPPLQYLSAMSHARCRAGVWHKKAEERFEIMLSNPENRMEDLILQFDHYLRKIGYAGK